jgi:ABC-2 type transport system permease protein
MRWRCVFGIARAYVKSFIKDKSNIFWVILWPIILLLLTAYVFVPPTAGSPMTLDVGIVDKSNLTSSFLNGTSLVDILNNVTYNGTKMFNASEFSNESQLVDELRKGRLDAGIIIPKNFTIELAFGTGHIVVMIGGESPYDLQINRAIMQIFLSSFSQHLSLYKVEMMLKYMGNYTFINKTITTPLGPMRLEDLVTSYLRGIAVPLNVSVREVAPKSVVDRSYILGWYSLGALGMMMLYTGFVIGAIAIVEEKERGRLHRLISTPMTEADLLAGKIVGGLAVLLFSGIIIVVFSALGLGARIDWTPTNPVHWLVPLHLILIALMTTGIGLILSLAAKSVRGGSNLAIMLGLIFSFIAGIWFPKQWLPPALQLLAKSFPVTWSLDVIRDIIVSSLPLSEVIKPTLYSITATIIILLLGLLSYKKTLRKYVEI